jgi:3-hydroxybutyryl-CoA dehydratase
MRKLEVGQSASFSKTISEGDVYGFAGITGDFNPVHINKVEAEKSVFGRRVVHGMLAGSLISAVLGTRLPGDGTIYLEQSLKFKHPVFFDDTVTAKVTVSEVISEEKGIYKLDTQVANQDKVITHEGYAIVKYI